MPTSVTTPLRAPTTISFHWHSALVSLALLVAAQSPLAAQEHSRLAAQPGIRQVDFKNFSYPLTGRLLGHNSLVWLDTSPLGGGRSRTFHLVNGSHLTRDSSVVVDGKEYVQFRGFTFQSVTYADLTGDGHEEAIVTLLYQTGGTQTTNYVYIYSPGQYGPRLLAYCHTGDRSDEGLYRVHAATGLLVFELLDPARASAECCSSGSLISTYRWRNGAFKLTGGSKRRALPPLDEQPAQ